MLSEISFAAFRALIPVETPCNKVEEAKLYRREYFHNEGLDCTALRVHSFAACTVQYFILDIDTEKRLQELRTAA